MEIIYKKEQKRFEYIKKVRREPFAKIYEKITGVMIGRCYKTISFETAEEFGSLLIENKMDIDPTSYVPLNFKYFEDPNSDISLTKDERYINKLLEKVLKNSLI